MRSLGRILLGLLILVPSLVGGYRLWDSLYLSELAAVLEGRIESALPTTTYRALVDGWLDFPLSGKGHALRVRTNGVTDPDASQLPDADWWYAFQYQLLDVAGKTLREGVYHHRTRLRRFRDATTGQLIGRNFLLDPTQVPTTGRGMLIYFSREEQPVRLRLRPLQKDPTLAFILFRVYEKLETPSPELDYLWQRFGESKKARLTVGSIYGSEFLQEQERRNLLRYQWKAVGPLGVEHEQYQSLKLYVAREMGGEPELAGIMPYGVYADQQMRAMIPVPEGEWEVKLAFIPLLETEAGAGAKEVRVRWYGRGLTQRWQAEVAADSGGVWLAKRFNGGLLELTASVPMVIRAWAKNDTGVSVITPERVQLRAYRAGPAMPLSLPIDHVGDSATPIRVDLRAQLQSTEETVDRTLIYEFLDAAGETLEKGRLQARLTRSGYDRLVISGQNDQALSEPSRYYFKLAPEVAVVRFTAQQETLITAYSRPPSLVREVQVPEDYAEFGDTPAKQPAWFLMRPHAAEQMRRENRTATLIVQPRPPETDPRLLAGQYDWRSYQPNGNWRGRYLLIPRQDDALARDQALMSVYRELTAGRPTRIHLRAPEGHRQIEPTLIFLRDDAAPIGIELRLDGESYYATRIAGKRGEIRLPVVRPGVYRLSIKADAPGRWFLNHAEMQAPGYLRRLALELGGKDLVFDYHKRSAEAEVLTGEFFSLSQDRSRIRVGIKGEPPARVGPLTDWTFRERVFDLQPGAEGAVPVLNAKIDALRGGQRFVLPLGADLPAGHYRLQVALEGGDKGFLTLYRLIAGQPEIRTFFRERIGAL